MKIRHATREDLVRWYGSVPATMRAIVIEDEGDLVGIAGVARMSDHLQAFSAIGEALRPHKMVIGRAAVMFAQMLSEYTVPVLAICSDSEPTAPGLLSHLGFAPAEVEGVWRHG